MNSPTKSWSVYIQKATINKKMVVKKLYTKGNNKMATLFNEEEKISIETDFIENLFKHSITLV